VDVVCSRRRGDRWRSAMGSSSPASSGALVLEVRDRKVEPTDPAVFIADGYGVTSTMEEWSLVNLLTTVDDAETWAGGHQASARR
jgi:hypothetical protein